MELDTFLLDGQLRSFLREDLEHGDVTTEALFSGDETALVSMVARQDLVAVGMERVAARIFCLLGGGTITFGQMAADGERKKKGEVLMTIGGPARTLLRGERVALNLVQRLCGIATLTAEFVDRVRGLDVKIADTRKTTPGLRMLEKYAVRAGGGVNHRYSLADGVLIKDNHIAACGSIAEAARRVRARVPHTLTIEVECDTLDQVRECLDNRVPVIMLDNMDPAAMRQAVGMAAGRALLEASGGVTLETVRAIAETGVDIISIGRLTHSAPACDIGMDWVH